MSPRFFMGIDQTGALKKKGGSPKPLPMALIEQHRPEEAELQVSWLPLLRHEFVGHWPNLQILVDCVLGLPRNIGAEDLSVDFLRAREFQSKHGWGREVAENFFRDTYPSAYAGDNFPQRECEKLAKANSVFRARPYQRNIQTGTYRLWSELGADVERGIDWFSIWAQDEKKAPLRGKIENVRIGEGYPSLSWRIVTGNSFRRPETLSRTLKAKFPNLRLPRNLVRSEITADQADAVILAVHLWSQGGFSSSKRRPSRDSNTEGWIFGLDET